MSSNVKFEYYADLYLKFGKSEWKPSTLYKYKNILTRLTLFYNRDIASIKSSEVRLYLSDLRTHLTQKTIKDYKSVLHQIFDLAKFDEVILNNPVDFIKKTKCVKPKILPFNANETNLILNSLYDKNINFAMFIRVGFFTGMRTGEILALKMKDVNLENRTISISATRSRFGEGSPKTIYSIRTIPILNILHCRLKNYMEKYYLNEYLIQTQYKKPYKDTNVFSTDFWRLILKDLNLPYRRLYNMRHTYATTMLYGNFVTPVELAKLLGHSNPKMIYDVYVNYLNSNLKDFKRDIVIY